MISKLVKVSIKCARVKSAYMYLWYPLYSITYASVAHAQQGILYSVFV